LTQRALVFIGTYTEPILFGTGKILEGKSEGIYLYSLDLTSGQMEQVDLTRDVPNPSFLALDPSRRFLYAVNELKEFEGAPTGAVSAFSVDPSSGELRFLNRKPAHGTDPCHLQVHKTGKYVFVANFASGSVCVLPILADGSLGDATDVVQHQGSSVDPVRQSGPHAHAVTSDDSGHYAFVPDLGIDKLMVYRFDVNLGKLEPHDPPWVEVHPGAGPRQLVLHPQGRYAYLINELDSTVTVLQCDWSKGILRKLQTVSTLPPGFEGASTCAEVQISPSGEFLYGSNRGHDSIVLYAIDRQAGTLALIGHESTRGRTPRHFAVSPGGDLLLVANQDSDNLVSFKVDPASGELLATGHVAHVPMPVCVKFL
jgi:6-phosphogluconolactonase